MSFLTRGIYGPEDPSFTPLFRLLHDFDSYSRSNQPEGGRRKSSQLPLVNPKFDIHETPTSFELHGELPGIQRQNVNIEFTDGQTIMIHGRIERAYSAGTPPSAPLDAAKSGGAITEAGEDHASSHKATVEDEADEEVKEKGRDRGSDGNTAQVAHHHGAQARARNQQPQEKYWVTERTVGEFSRSFTFPTLVDHDAVSARLDNGILNITVPKAKKRETRRIAVN